MAQDLKRGEIWMYHFKKPDKTRPVLVLTRQDVLGLLHTATVAPITSTQLGSPAEVKVGVAEGLKQESAVNLDHIHTVEQSALTRFVGTVSAVKMQRVCAAAAVALGCDGVS